jgi:O-methyltransferase involved in polyketide biosynthesis
MRPAHWALCTIRRGTGRPSITALGAAAARAAHQRIEGGRVFSDPLAVR